jgi:hypothetical protein
MSRAVPRPVTVFVLLFCGGLALGEASAQSRLSEHTLTLDPGTESPPADLGAIDWLAGRWTGEALGGYSEETWNPAIGGAMVGTYRLVKEDKVALYELMTIVEESGTLVYRLKHFNADMTGWEEKDQSQVSPLVKVTPDRVHFDGTTFEKRGADTVAIYVVLRHPDGATEEAEIVLHRAAQCEAGPAERKVD